VLARGLGSWGAFVPPFFSSAIGAAKRESKYVDSMPLPTRERVAKVMWPEQGRAVEITGSGRSLCESGGGPRTALRVSGKHVARGSRQRMR
jgi:hypothetical protein